MASAVARCEMQVNHTCLVNQKGFIQAARDSGYRDTDAAIAELIDNSLQAGAHEIRVVTPLATGNSGDQSIAVLDDGAGMTLDELMTCLQFGGSSRFGDRNGLGRFGMGLPNSSLSQGRCVDVYTWKDPGFVRRVHLDLDTILCSVDPRLPDPVSAAVPEPYRSQMSTSGTLVIWRKLDRAKPKNWRAFTNRLALRLSQKYRYFIWNGCRISVDGCDLLPFDPLFLSGLTRTPSVLASQYGEMLTYEIPFTGVTGRQGSSQVRVRFSELSVADLAGLSADDKRRFGIANGAGVSIIRAGREIDYGWYFIDKRRENYDDWWRCEVSFSPELDELFGVSYNKQGVRPSENLRSLLTPCIGSVARLLNRRARVGHQDYSARIAQSPVRAASGLDRFLRPIVVRSYDWNGQDGSDSTRACGESIAPDVHYQFIECEVLERVPYSVTSDSDGTVTIAVNTLHEFYDRVYRPLRMDSDAGRPQMLRQVQMIILALARSELVGWNESEQHIIDRYKREWSRAISVFLKGARV